MFLWCVANMLQLQYGASRCALQRALTPRIEQQPRKTNNRPVKFEAGAEGKFLKSISEFLTGDVVILELPSDSWSGRQCLQRNETL